MSRARINKYLKKLAVIIFLAILAFIVLTLLTRMILKKNNNKTSLGEDLVNKNTSIYQSITLSNDEITKLNEFLDNYINLCNEKKYQDIYNLYSDSYKKRFNVTIEDVKDFCDKEFDKYKLYDYQNLSVINNKVIYELKIYDDIMATGVNSFDDYDYNAITVVITKALDGTYRISLNGYIETVEYNKVNDYQSYVITVLNKDVYYQHEIYKIKVKNLSNNECLCMFKNYNLDNAKLQTVYQELKTSLDCKTMLNPFISNLLVYPSSEKEFELKFDKYYDITNLSKIDKLYFENISYISYDILDNIIDVNELNQYLLQNSSNIEIELNN